MVLPQRAKSARLQFVQRRGWRGGRRGAQTARRPGRDGTEAAVELGLVIVDESLCRHFEMEATLLQGFDNLRLASKRNDDVVGKVRGDEEDRATGCQSERCTNLR